MTYVIYAGCLPSKSGDQHRSTYLRLYTVLDGLWFIVALCNRQKILYIFILFLSSSSFFISSPNFSGQRLDVTIHHIWCVLSANLECRSEMCCTWLAKIQDTKMTQKIAISVPSHNFVGPYLRN